MFLLQHFGKVSNKTLQWIKDHYGQKTPEHTIITYNDDTTTVEVEVGDDGILTQTLVRNAGDYTTIQSVKIGSDVTTIGRETFSNCSGLTSVTIPSSATVIEASVFDNCTSLTSVTILDGVTSIGGRVFAGCSGLTSVVIPSSVTWIGWYVFSNCSSLTNVILENRTLEEAKSLIGTSNSFGYTGTVTYNGGTYTTVYSDPNNALPGA